MNRIQRHRNVLASLGALTAVAGFAALVAAPAHAQEATYELPQPVVSTQSRADVQAQTLQARRAGTVFVAEANWPALPMPADAVTREAVREDVRAARAEGTLILGVSEPHGFATTAARGERLSAMNTVRWVR